MVTPLDCAVEGCDHCGSRQLRGSADGEGLNNAPKYVASRTFTEPLAWPTRPFSRATPPTQSASCKHELTGDLTIMGSGGLVQALMRRDLIDEYLLFIHPLLLGTGRRLFSDGGPQASLRRIESKPAVTDVLITRCETAKSTP